MAGDNSVRRIGAERIGMLQILAPAKINLVLEVLGKGKDGYHRISSIILSINLCDILSFELDNDISVDCSDPSLPVKDNLVFRAAWLMKQISGYDKGVKIKLVKQIPSGVGLGGGSSDAAATLMALNQLWELRLPLSQLVKLAARLGSDVPFFLYQGLAVTGGRGEKIKPLSTLVMPWFVILVPPLPRLSRKTEYMYSCLRPEHYTKGEFTRKAEKFLSRGETFSSSLLFNVFDRVADMAFPGLSECRERFIAAGATNVCLAGSGPALFSLIEKKNVAKELYEHLREQGLECYLVSTFLPK